MCKQTGCFGSFIRIILSLINIVFLLCGLAVFLIAAALKWADTTLISRFIKDEGIRSIIDVSAFDTVSWALLVLGAFIVLLSLIGLIGACCANRFFLVIYEIILIMLFLSHGVLLIIGGIKSAEVEKSLRNALEDTVRSIQTANHSSLAIAMKESETTSISSHIVHDEDEIVVKKCKAMKLISEMFECCGSQSLNDLNADLRGVCCFSENSKHACSNQIVHALKTNGINVIIIPNSVILCFEFVLILIVPFLIGRITKSKRDDRDQFEGSGHHDDGYTYHMKPTTYMHGGRGDYRD